VKKFRSLIQSRFESILDNILVKIDSNRTQDDLLDISEEILNAPI
jgi:hypothetical protein